MIPWTSREQTGDLEIVSTADLGYLKNTRRMLSHCELVDSSSTRMSGDRFSVDWGQQGVCESAKRARSRRQTSKASKSLSENIPKDIRVQYIEV